MQGVRPYSPLEQFGRNIYIREGCYNCHSQQIRPFRDEVERYGHYSLAAESMYDHPFQWGSKRTGPDLARVGGRYSDDWHRVHLINPRDVVPESNMPSYPWLENTLVSAGDVTRRMRALQTLGDPYTDEQIAATITAVKAAAEGPMKGILKYTEDPIVSSDIIGNSHGAIFDAGMTRVIDGNMVKIISWYDNEWSYTSQYIRLTKFVADKL